MERYFPDLSCVPMIAPTQYVVVKFRFGSKNERTESYGHVSVKWQFDMLIYWGYNVTNSVTSPWRLSQEGIRWAKTENQHLKSKHMD